MVRTEIVNMTPEMATELLECNTINRKPRQARVKGYVDLINRGEWVLTHQGVAVSNENTLLDGQHRLMAIVESGVTVPIMITTGMSELVFSAIDSGMPRNMADLTKIDRKQVDVLMYIFSAVMPATKPTPKMIEDIYSSRIGSQAIKACATRNARVLSAAPARAAATVLSLLHGDSIIDLYRGITSPDFDSLYPVQKALLKKLTIHGDIVNKSKGTYSSVSVRNERYAYIHYSLNPDNRYNNRVSVSESYKSGCIAELREIVTSIVDL